MDSAIDTIVVLADGTASCVVAGLTQLERIAREVERSRRLAGDDAERLPLWVVWRTREQRDAQPPLGGRTISVDLHHVMADGPEGRALAAVVEEGSAVAFSTRDVWAPGTLPLQGTVPGRRTSQAPLGGGGPVASLDGPADVPRAERALFQALGKPTDGYVTRLVNRRLSTIVSRRLARTAVTPNHVSGAVAALFLASALVMVKSGWAMLLLGTVLYKLGDILDGCDGELARVTFTESRFGAWLDTVIDMIGNMLFIGALGIGLSRQPGLAAPWGRVYLWEGLLAVTAMAAVILALMRYTKATSGAAHFAGFGTSMAGSLPDASVLRPVVLFLSRVLRRDAYSWAFVALAVAGHPAWILHAQTGGLVIYFLGLWYAGRLVAAGRPRLGSESVVTE